MSPGTGSFYCDKFDAIQCKNDNITCETSKIKCELHYGVEPACFAIWTNSSDKGVVVSEYRRIRTNFLRNLVYFYINFFSFYIKGVGNPMPI